MRRMTQRVVLVVLIVGSLGSLMNSKIGMASSHDLIRDEQRIDITIQDYQFLLPQPVSPQLGKPTVIILRNQDIVRHGFTSKILGGALVTGEGEGIAVYGEGINGFYVDPGKTLVLRLTVQNPGQYSFRCDLHPDMKGEMVVLDMTRT